METDIHTLGSKGLVNIPYPPDLRRGIENAVAMWQKFCTLPEEIKMKFPYQADTVTGAGYELKKVPGATLDLKENFQFDLEAKDWCLEEARKIGNPTISAFVNELTSLVEVMKPTVLSFAQEVEREYVVKDFGKEITENPKNWVIRFLHYFGGAKPGEEIAKAHSDKSGFTLHLYESDPGLQYLDREYHWQDMPVSTGETAIIPGMRMQYRSEGRLKATCHRVVATPETAQRGRFSAVAFIHPGSGTPQYNKEGAGRLQEFKPGFNYEMPFEEFAKLFK